MPSIEAKPLRLERPPLSQPFARHASPDATVAYTHVSDEEIYSAISAI
jgi:hypothetical protein